MPWQVFGPMARRQERVAEERREDRARRVEQLKERRARGEQVEEAEVVCPSCGETRPAEAMRLQEDGSLACAWCIDGEELDASARRSLWGLAVACGGGIPVALILAGFATFVVDGELNMTLTSAAVGLILAATGWSARRRAQSLLRTADVVAVPEGLTRTTSGLGLAAMIVGGCVILATPLAWALNLVEVFSQVTG